MTLPVGTVATLASDAARNRSPRSTARVSAGDEFGVGHVGVDDVANPAAGGFAPQLGRRNANEHHRHVGVVFVEQPADVEGQRFGNIGCQADHEWVVFEQHVREKFALERIVVVIAPGATQVPDRHEIVERGAEQRIGRDDRDGEGLVHDRGTVT